MLTVLALFCIFIVLAFIVAVVIGIIAVSPIMLVLVCLAVLDYFLFKIVFGKGKKKWGLFGRGNATF